MSTFKISSFNLLKYIDRSVRPFLTQELKISYLKNISSYEAPNLEEGTGIEDTAYDLEADPSEAEPQVKNSVKIRLQLDAEWWAAREGGAGAQHL